MSQSQTSADSRRPGFGTLVWITLLLVIIYPLSAGPVAKLIELEHLPEGSFVAFYSPLTWQAEQSDPVADFLYWYLTKVWDCHF